jgi:D-alanyl-D-alanine endopeptidase (penicillin-binding protein 7)
MLLFPLSAGCSKSSNKNYYHQKKLTAKKRQIPRSLVLRSAAVLVEDQQTGECLVRKQAEAILPIASITKLMTAMVVLDADMDLEESLTIKNEDVDTVLHSHSRLPIGIHLTRREVLLLALMSSDNRAAYALGRTYPGGFGACVKAMNVKAGSLGLSETRFEDTAGLHSGNVSSARDLARLVDNAYRYGLICEFTTCKRATVYSGRRAIEFHNTNRLVQNSGWEIGLSKTGFTDEAGRCLVMQAHVAQRPLLIVLLDSQGKMTRIGDANRIKHWLESRSSSQRLQEG